MLHIESVSSIWRHSYSNGLLTSHSSFSSGVLWKLWPLLICAEPPAATDCGTLHSHHPPRMAHTHCSAPGATALHEEMRLNLSSHFPRGLAPKHEASLSECVVCENIHRFGPFQLHVLNHNLKPKYSVWNLFSFFPKQIDLYHCIKIDLFDMHNELVFAPLSFVCVKAISHWGFNMSQ